MPADDKWRMGPQKARQRSLPRRALGKARRLALDALAKTPMGTVVDVKTNEPVAAITFDDGPDGHWTPQVLDVLEAHGAHGTFFVIGKYVREHHDIMARMAASGHAIGNHSWDHPCFPLLSSSERRRQVRACAEALTPYLRGDVRLFRPPYLDQNLASAFDLWSLGYQVIATSVHACDWEDHDAAFMVERLHDGIRSGAIIMLHDVIRDRDFSGRQAMLDSLDMFLDRWKRAYRFVTVPELLQCGKPRKQTWLKGPSRERMRKPVPAA